MSICCIPVSLGELYDKYSILLIKLEKITDPSKLDQVNTEVNLLKPYVEQFQLGQEHQDKLKKINETLWDIEDNIRIKEKKQEFDEEFILLARQVYKTNDIRASIKEEINILLDSVVVEVKSYA
jgi:prophage tail gpP-like protein